MIKEPSLAGSSVGRWVEPWGDGNVLLHHEGDLAGMASLQWMLPFHGHAFVVLTNENDSPARFALGLAVADALLGLAPPTPSYSERYLAALRQGRAEAAAADRAARDKIKSTPAPGRSPRFALTNYTGTFAHPAYGTATISVDGGGLRLCGAATLWHANNSAMDVPACAPLLHAYYESFALGATKVDDVSAGTLMLEFYYDDAAGAVERFEAPVEPKVAPIAFRRG